MTDTHEPARLLVGRLAAIVGSDHVLTDPALMDQFVVDWSRRWRGDALAVVRPGSTDEVSRILGICSDAGVPVVPQGGNTGLVGGSVPGNAADGPLPVVLPLLPPHLPPPFAANHRTARSR